MYITKIRETIITCQTCKVISKVKEKEINITLSILLDTLSQFILLFIFLPKQLHSWFFFPIKIKIITNIVKKKYMNNSIVIFHIEVFPASRIVKGINISVIINRAEKKLIKTKLIFWFSNSYVFRAKWEKEYIFKIPDNNVLTKMYVITKPNRISIYFTP